MTSLILFYKIIYDFMEDIMGRIILLAILILINAFFSAAEIAFISLNDAKIERQAKELII